MNLTSFALRTCAMAAALAFALPAAAKTLVYCSEGSPENFTPALNTTGTSFDAALSFHKRASRWLSIFGK